MSRHAPSVTGAPQDAVLREPPLDLQLLKARIVWYYHVGGLTQQEIADRLAVTRLRVNRTIQEARADGSVRVELNLPLVDCVRLEEALSTRFDLAECAVLPELTDPDQQKRTVGEAAGAMLDRHLVDGQTIGVGWGGTLAAALQRIAARDHKQSKVVALMGGLTRGPGTNTFEVASRLAERLTADCFYLPAPVYCPTVDSREALGAHLGLAEVLDAARELDLAMVSCGDVAPSSILVRSQVTPAEQAEMRGRGAVGDILGIFVDAQGREIDHDLNRRVVALAPADLARVPIAILAACGDHKLATIRACLHARYVNRLVTDEAVARALLDETAS